MKGIALVLALTAIVLVATLPGVNAFCGGSYSNRYPLTPSGTQDPYLVNVTINGHPQYIWTSISSNYLCYTDETDYATYNDDAATAFSIEYGNGTSGTNPWTANYTSVLYYEGTGQDDQSIYNQTVTELGTVETVDADGGRAIYFTQGAADGYELPGGIIDYSTGTICAVAKVDSWSGGGYEAVFGDTDSNSLIGFYRNGGDTAGYYKGTINNHADPAAGGYTVFCITWDASNGYYYTNTTQVGSTAEAGGPSGTTNVYFGKWLSAAATDRTIDGSIKFSWTMNATQDADDFNEYVNMLIFHNYTTVGSSESSGSAPQYSSNTTTPTTPQTYPVAQIMFNVTWTDDTVINTSWLEHNFSGTMQNEYMSNVSDEHYITLTGMAAGYYAFQFHANNTGGTTNSTGYAYFTINKATAELNLTINGTESNHSGTFLETVNVTSWTNISGVTPTIYENSSAVANPLIYNPAYGYYNYTAILDHENYTASPKVFWSSIAKAASGLTLSSSPSWSISEDTEVTITCTANSPLTLTLTRDGVEVSNPYIATLDFDIYSFACTVSDTYNYTPSTTSNNLNVVSGGFGCTNTDTYAFEINVTVPAATTNMTFDFTTIREDYLVLANLGDVFPMVNTSPRGWRNTTNDFFIVNTTGYAGQVISIRFGNNIIDNNWNTTSNTTTETSYTYSEINPYMKLTFVDERTGTIQLPPSANHTLFIFCSGGISSHNITGDRMTVATFERADEINARVQYSVTEIYARNYAINADVETMNVYLVDADEDQVVQILLSLQDATGDFDGALLKSKKYIEGTLRTITEHYFDAEAKVIIYLINGDKYSLYVDNGAEERSIGFLYVDSVDLSKTLTIGEVLTTNQTHGNLSFGFYNTTNSIVFALVDGSGLTSSAEMWIYNETDDLIYYTNSTNKTSIEFTYAVSNTTMEYKVHVKIHHHTFGLNSIDLWSPFFGLLPSLPNPASMFDDAGMIGEIPGANGATFEDLAGVGTIIGAAFLFTATTGPIGGIIAAFVAAFLVYFGWYGVNIAIIAVALVLAAINKLTEDRRAS